jgi:hypothetical protein
MTCCETDLVVSESEAEDPRCEASRALRRLVGFVASALDVRFAFVVAFDPPGSPRRIGLWLARDYGLRSEYAQVEAPSGCGRDASLDLGLLLHQVWPHEPELADVPPGRRVSLALVDPQGRVVGHLGILDSEGSCRLAARERLAPLGRRARAEVEGWMTSPASAPERRDR